jgi:beta-glucanase (GH16 family)
VASTTRKARGIRPANVLGPLAGLLACALCALPQAVTGQATEPARQAANATDRPGWRLVWHDEFDTVIGPDWTFDIGTGTNNNGWGNNEHQYYTSRPENVRVENGVLVIEARRERYESREFTSARLKTAGRKAFRFGRFEARIKIPRGQGIWPAFWALGDDFRAAGWPKCGEIDVMENVGREPDKVHGTVHGPGYSGGNGISGTFELPRVSANRGADESTAAPAFADDFHVFAVDWDAAKLTFSVDGRVYHTVTPADARGTWAFDHPFFLLLNLAVGGNWPGPPGDDTPFPARMFVDYVRVYERAR